MNSLKAWIRITSCGLSLAFVGCFTTANQSPGSHTTSGPVYNPQESLISVSPTPTGSANPADGSTGTNIYAGFAAKMATLSTIPGNSNIKAWRHHAFNAEVSSSDRRNWMDIYYPVGQVTGAPTILYLHGGMLVHGSKNGDYKYTVVTTVNGTSTTKVEELVCSAEQGQTDANCQCPAAPLAYQGYVVACLNYHLATQQDSSGNAQLLLNQIKEAKIALNYLSTYYATLGVDKDRIVAMGVEIGGYIATMLGATSRPATSASAIVGVLDDRESVNGVDQYRVVGKVNAVVTYSGVYNPALISKYFHNGAKNSSGVLDQRFDPLYQAQARGGMVPMLMVHGDADQWNIQRFGSTTAETISMYPEAVTFRNALQNQSNSGVALFKVAGANNAQFRTYSTNVSFWRFNTADTVQNGAFSFITNFLQQSL